MVSVGVSALGQTGFHFVDQGAKVNGQYYRDILLVRDLLPDIKESSDYFTFQQDGRSPSASGSCTVELLKAVTPDFIPPNLWPSTSPDSNPVDYKIWGILQERVYRTKVKDVSDLKQRNVNEWDKLHQSVFNRAIGQWRKRLRACVAAARGHFECKM